MAATQFGIDLPGIYRDQNALAVGKQQQQINAFQIGQQKRTSDYQNALAAAPDDKARVAAMQTYDPEKALVYAGQLTAQQRATHDYQTQQTIDALGALDGVPDEVLTQATSAVLAKLKSDGVQGVDELGQTLAAAGNDPVKLRAAVKQQAQMGLDYKSQLAEQDKTATRANASKQAATAAAAQTESARANKAREAQAAATLAESKRHNQEAEAAANPFGSVVAPAGAVAPNGQVAPPRPTGDAFLQTLPPQLQGQVKMLAEGKLAIPSGQALRTPYWQQLLQAANQYDPSLDQASAPARFKTRAAFSAGGTEAKTINNLNTAIGHAGTLLDQIGGVAGHSIPIIGTAVNAGENYISQHSGHPGVMLFKDTAGKLAQELTAVYRNSGGAEKDVVRGLESLDVNASDDQKKAVLGNAVDLLQSKMDALGDQYNRGMGTTKDPLELLNSHAQATFRKLRSGGQPEQAGASGAWTNFRATP